MAEPGQARAEQAAAIRAFVAGMPNDQTRGEQREAELKAAFTKPQSQVATHPQDQAPKLARQQGQKARQGVPAATGHLPPPGQGSQPVEAEKMGVEPSTPDQGDKKGRSR